MNAIDNYDDQEMQSYRAAVHHFDHSRSYEEGELYGKSRVKEVMNEFVGISIGWNKKRGNDENELNFSEEETLFIVGNQS